VDTLVTHYRSPRGVSVSVRPFRELARDAGETGLFNLALFLGASSLAALLAWWIASKITGPLKNLVAAMRSVESGQLGAEVAAVRDDEIGELTLSFNSMSAHLRTLVEEVYKSGLAKKEAELKALQAQINPHFLYNTLDVIYWTARTEGAARAAEAAAALSRLFKLGLNKGEELTTLGVEIQHLESYVVIQNMRFDVPPELTIDIEPALRDCVVTKLVLQPLVENAYLHGIADLDRPGRISVTGRATDGIIVLVVEDNGIGMDGDRIAQVMEKDVSGERGFGVRNVDQTVKLFFGSEYGLSIESSVGFGTRAALRFPERHSGQGG
jgi:two-component system, sensor histidine kinase YesM